MSLRFFSFYHRPPRMGWGLLALLALLLLLAPTLARAQSAAPATTTTATASVDAVSDWTLKPDDLSRKTFLEPLFGPLIAGSTTESPLTQIMLVFNGALLFLGGILVAYTIVVGTMRTAHDGEMLGRQWSSLWIPIRTSLGAAAVMPVVGNGWCVAQVIVLWLGMQGAGIANILWSTFVDGSANYLYSATYNPPTNLVMVRKAYAQMYVNSTCVAAVNALHAGAGADALTMGTPSYGMKPVTTATQAVADAGLSASLVPDTSLTINYGDTTISDLAQSAIIIGTTGTGLPGALPGSENSAATAPGRECGTVTVAGIDTGDSIVANASADNASNAAGTGTSGPKAALFSLNLGLLLSPIATARTQAITNAANEIQAFANQVQAGTVTPEQSKVLLPQLLDKQVAAYGTAMANAAKQVFTESMTHATGTTFKTAMKADGWANAGAFYMALARVQNSISRAYSIWPTATGPAADTLSSNSSLASPDVRRALLVAYNGLTAIPRAAYALEVATKDFIEAPMADRVLGYFLGPTGDPIQFDKYQPTDNPILIAQSVGDKMLGIAGIAIVGLIGITLLPGVLAGSSSLLGGLVSAFLVPGVILSTYIPMMPYIIWLGSMFGWGVLMIEAVLAAPLWAIVHLAPDGEGLTGRGGQGYMLILSLVLRPPLMIIGLIVAFVLMRPVGFLLTSTFASAFYMTGSATGWLSLFRILAGVIIYMVVLIMLIKKVFALIYVVPDKLLRWIGGGGNDISEHGALAEHAHGGVATAAGASLAAGSMLASTANNAQARNRDKKARERDASLSGQREAQAAQAQIQQAAMDAGPALGASDVQKNASQDRADGMPADAAAQESASRHASSFQAQANRAAETQAQADNSPAAQTFREGMAAARNSSDPGAVSAFQSQQASAARQQQEAYATAQDKQRAGQPLTSEDKKALKDGPPREFQESLMRAQEAGDAAQKYGQKARDILTGRAASGSGSIPAATDGDSIRPRNTQSSSVPVAGDLPTSVDAVGPSNSFTEQSSAGEPSSTSDTSVPSSAGSSLSSPPASSSPLASAATPSSGLPAAPSNRSMFEPIQPMDRSMGDRANPNGQDKSATAAPGVGGRVGGKESDGEEGDDPLR